MRPITAFTFTFAFAVTVGLAVAPSTASAGLVCDSCSDGTLGKCCDAYGCGCVPGLVCDLPKARCVEPTADTGTTDTGASADTARTDTGDVPAFDTGGVDSSSSTDASLDAGADASVDIGADASSASDTGASASPAAGDSSSGCGCRVAPSSESHWLIALGVSLGLGALVRRSRAARRSSASAGSGR